MGMELLERGAGNGAAGGLTNRCEANETGQET